MENKELLYGYLVNNFKNKNFSEYTCENIMNDHFNGERQRQLLCRQLLCSEDLEKLNLEKTN